MKKIKFVIELALFLSPSIPKLPNGISEIIQVQEFSGDKTPIGLS